MVSPALLMKTWLLTDSVSNVAIANPLLPLLNSLFIPGAPFPNNDPNRVYVGHLPASWDPQFGPGVVIRVGAGTTAGTGGGAAHPELPLTKPRLQITSFAGRQEYETSDGVYFAIHDWIHRRNNIDIPNVGFVLSCLESVEGQQVEDPHTFYATNISFWALNMREELI